MTTLRELRRRAGLNQAGLAYFASERGEAGQPWISDIERSSKDTSRPTLAIYALLSLLTPEQIEEAKAIIDEVERGFASQLRERMNNKAPQRSAAYFGEFAQAFRLKAPTISAKPPTRIESWWVPGPNPGFTL
ncbi:hypothetical protein [Azospirillum brasilense]|uniref:XRE family transcriptional regulator n=1 Tax=Azospirillum brasilense TaxID=192 RepID=A0A6L3AST6_AZOBR|nr:hypothetical protein [Azospirillum brasilense]KAA0678215.1 XRE family transcriptional regulator [Azospirillum brasilense]